MIVKRKPAELDGLIHEPARLRLMAALDACVSADFMFLAGVTRLTRGNLSTHMAKLVNAGYVSEAKDFVARKPRTEYRITEPGRKAYRSYLKEWARITGR
jgi:DNA-binding MarR family transcriptional regulator